MGRDEGLAGMAMLRGGCEVDVQHTQMPGGAPAFGRLPPSILHKPLPIHRLQPLAVKKKTRPRR